MKKVKRTGSNNCEQGGAKISFSTWKKDQGGKKFSFSTWKKSSG